MDCNWRRSCFGCAGCLPQLSSVRELVPPTTDIGSHLDTILGVLGNWTSRNERDQQIPHVTFCPLEIEENLRQAMLFENKNNY